jgi:hypothetical protein
LTSALRRLKRTTPQEIGFRSRAMVGRWYEERQHMLGLARDPAPRLVRPAAGAFVFKNPFQGDPREVAAALRGEKAYVARTRLAADDTCANRFRFFGRTFSYGAGPLPWRADPVSGRDWPAAFHTRIDIFGGAVRNGDVKYVWELNRHQFLPTLGKAYMLTGEEAYAATGLDLLDDWIRANPYKVGINWTSALEVAVRALAWLWALALFEGSPALTAERRQRYVRSLFQHGRYIEEHLSFFFSPYNHLVGEAAALCVLGGQLPCVQPARRWAHRGWDILASEIERQFHRDGGTVEQATGYHHFTVGFYLQALFSRRRVGMLIEPHVWSRLERAFEFSMQLTRPDGAMPMIGDGDEGKALDLEQSDFWNFAPMLALGAALFRRGDFKAVAGDFSPDVAWLLGRSSWEALEALPARPPSRTATALEASGYYIMRTGWDRAAHHLVFDCGDLADGVPRENLPSAAHGHADALSFELSAHGVPLIVDPGFQTYNGPMDWHRYFRETEAHNTVVVDGCSQADHRGRLTWALSPRVERLHWVTSPALDFVEGYQTGYQRLAQPVLHRRSIAFAKPDYWIVRDELIGEGEHDVESWFHFAAVPAAVCSDGRSVRTLHGAGNVLLMPAEPDGRIELVEPHDGPSGGWVAPGYERMHRAPVARYRRRARLPLVLHTIVVPFETALPSIEVVPLTPTPRTDPLASGFFVRLGDREDLWVFSPDGREATTIDGYATDAHVACVRRRIDRREISCTLVGGSSLLVGGRPVLDMEQRVDVAALVQKGDASVLKLSHPARPRHPVPCRIVIGDPAEWEGA